MSTRITLRLAGLTAAIAVALALTSAADAKPTSGAIYVTATGTTGIHPATGPADRPGEVGTPAAVPLSVSTPAVISSQSSGFNWSDAMLGALAAFAITLSAGFAVGLMRGRGGIALRL